MTQFVYEASPSAKYFFPLPNELFDLGLSVYEIAIYAYLMRIEDRKTFQSYASYATIASALGIAANTVGKYVRELEEHGLIQTEQTKVIMKNGTKRNGCLMYHILPIKNAVELYQKKKLDALQRMTDQQEAWKKAGELGISFAPRDLNQGAEKTAS
ncbi:MAG: helix-turn-helix domain-containing protein [Candidatus Limivicinus sp.]|nr:helix-turn-helix domain-containing protein [Candidatus Limivicinus sp.]